jgi:hypothetical protein
MTALRAKTAAIKNAIERSISVSIVFGPNALSFGQSKSMLVAKATQDGAIM